MSGYFPSITDDIKITKQQVDISQGVTIKNKDLTVKYFQFKQCTHILFLQSRYNKCYEGDVVEVGNLENMDKNENGIRWFETQHSANCRYTNTVIQLSGWKKEFTPKGQSQIYNFLDIPHLT